MVNMDEFCIYTTRPLCQRGEEINAESQGERDYSIVRDRRNMLQSELKKNQTKSQEERLKKREREHE